jgi:hypothetical protein
MTTTNGSYAAATRRAVYKINWPWRGTWRARFLSMNCLVSEAKGGVFVCEVTREQERWIDWNLQERT